MIQQGLTLSFKSDMLQAAQNLQTDTLKLALYTGNAALGPSTAAYDTTDEVVGTGYTAGGNTLTGASINVDADSNTVYVSFNNVSWPGAAFAARGGLIYNASKGNKSVAVLDFGAERSFTAAVNTVSMPVNAATTALIRFP